jgi:hypothetical protein
MTIIPDTAFITQASGLTRSRPPTLSLITQLFAPEVLTQMIVRTRPPARVAR